MGGGGSGRCLLSGLGEIESIICEEMLCEYRLRVFLKRSAFIVFGKRSGRQVERKMFVKMHKRCFIMCYFLFCVEIMHNHPVTRVW